jgi:hypothetical protein
VASSRFWWVAPAVVAFFASVAAAISVVSIRSNAAIARKRATLDLIERSESTEYYQRSYAAFTEVRKDPSGLMQLAEISNPHLLEQRQRVLNFLNHYELIAIGIKKGILDEDVYETFMRSTVVRDWEEAREFVNHIRRPTPDSGATISAGGAFCEFQALAEKWSHKVQRTGSSRAAKSQPQS